MEVGTEEPNALTYNIVCLVCFLSRLDSKIDSYIRVIKCNLCKGLFVNRAITAGSSRHLHNFITGLAAVIFCQSDISLFIMCGAESK